MHIAARCAAMLIVWDTITYILYLESDAEAVLSKSRLWQSIGSPSPTAKESHSWGAYGLLGSQQVVVVYDRGATI